ncbi:hypothetical protein CASFOL_010114 [Castilleja foliolosa]|uniref:RING-type domain-containing protein n=1 Tax=Castilleja foliolosa TaxID=1961234 RepID=A0ABD3DVP0_9LAMI
MSHQVVRVKREAVAPCMTCPLCHKLLREATTIIECLHTFCKKCIYKKLSDEEMESCPICNIYLGCVPLEKLRLDHNLQDVRAKIFPHKRIKVQAPEIVPPVSIMLPAKRKERSLSSLVVSTPRVSSSTQIGMTGRRSKSTARKAPRGSSFTIERALVVRRDEESMDEQPESSSSPDTLKNFTQNTRQNSSAGEPSDKRRENQYEAWEGKVDLWKPLSCLVEAANRTKSSKHSIQGPDGKSEAASHARDSEGLFGKSKNREQRQKFKVKEEKSCCSDHPPVEAERPKKIRRVRQKKAQDFGDFKVPSQSVLDGASAKSERKKYPVWFSLISDKQEGIERPLPQIASSYLRIKDGSIPVSFVQKYLKMKLDLTSEDEVEIKCMGQKVVPTLTLNNVVDMWLRTTITDRVSATIGSSAKEFVMVLGYARKAPDS